MQIRSIKVFTGIMLLMFVTGGMAHARTQKFKGSESGTAVDVPVDLDSDSCFVAVNGATVCTDTSSYANFIGTQSPGGSFTGQSISEADLVPGNSSCNIQGTMVPGTTICTLAGSNEQGCLLDAVGWPEVDRDSSSGDLLIMTAADFSVCDDLSKLPFNLTATLTETITGGTGKNAGASGTRTGLLKGQALSTDAAGKGFVWFEYNFTETITTP